ncbi:MAG: PaaI family thioesterase [Caldisericaceae bacterium]|nr:PaaI family thioesterase [Caldisericaceae bacterium]
MKKANYCFVCSETNPKGLHIKFRYLENGVAIAEFSLEKEYEGYPGIAHGGILAAILDDAMGNIEYLKGYVAYTTELHTRYIKPSYIGEELIARGWIKNVRFKVVETEGDIRNKAGKVKVRARAKYYLAGKIDEV